MAKTYHYISKILYVLGRAAGRSSLTLYNLGSGLLDVSYKVRLKSQGSK